MSSTLMILSSSTIISDEHVLLSCWWSFFIFDVKNWSLVIATCAFGQPNYSYYKGLEYHVTGVLFSDWDYMFPIPWHSDINIVSILYNNYTVTKNECRASDASIDS